MIAWYNYLSENCWDKLSFLRAEAVCESASADIGGKPASSSVFGAWNVGTLKYCAFIPTDYLQAAFALIGCDENHEPVLAIPRLGWTGSGTDWGDICPIDAVRIGQEVIPFVRFLMFRNMLVSP